MRSFLQRASQLGRVFLLALFVVVSGGSAAFLATKAPATAAGAPKEEVKLEKVSREGPDGVRVPADIARNAGLHCCIVGEHVRAIRLPPLQGCLAFDTNGLARVHSRFAGEIESLGTITEPASPTPSSDKTAPRVRPLQPGDAVRKGDLLAVVWSKDLGEKKSELIEALSKQHADDARLLRLKDAFANAGLSESSLRDAERAAESDRVAVEKAERTLRAWRLTEAEIAEVRAEADRLSTPETKRGDPTQWARVEVRATMAGIIVERNAEVGGIIDTTIDLFKIGDLSHLGVWAHLYEEDLPLLQAVPRPLWWTVTVPSRPGTTYAGTLEQIGAVIDPNQHTALVTGRVENPTGELKAGQFVTVAVTLPSPTGQVELPADAVVEDGRESIVFVRPSETEAKFVRVPVKVVRRFRDVVCIQAGGGIAPGNHVVTAGTLLLRDAMDELPTP